MPVPMKRKPRQLPDFSKDPVWQKLKEKMGIKPKKAERKEAMSIYSVRLYKLNGIQWVFDDPTKGIYREAFVGGASDLIDDIVKLYFPDRTDNEFVLNFSSTYFPNSYSLSRVEMFDDDSSDWILTSNNVLRTQGNTIWLCPTLKQYYDEEEYLYFNIKWGNYDENRAINRYTNRNKSA